MLYFRHHLRARRLLLALTVALTSLSPATAWAGDTDGDGLDDDLDNCPLIANEDQTNTDKLLPNGDFFGDACDDDDDNDGKLDGQDNCPLHPNTSQTNTDKLLPGGDLFGDACDDDDDADEVPDEDDNCAQVPNLAQTNNDADEPGDACDQDDDNDNVKDAQDNCGFVANAAQTDADLDGFGDECDDDDHDGIIDVLEEAAGTDPNMFDSDGDTISDGDEICDVDAPCDSNENGTIDALDLDSDGDGLKDIAEAGDADPFTHPVDSDGDGTPDFQDKDSDNDGTFDGDEKCESGADCLSGNCVKGVCCVTVCSGLCEACGDGTCSLLDAGFKPFGEGTCIGDTVVNLVCGEGGDLVEDSAVNCAPGICLNGQCSLKGECQGDADCSTLFGYCDEESHICMEKQPKNGACATDRHCLADFKCVGSLCGTAGEASCGADGFTLIAVDGKTETDCSPYACQNAACLTTCDTVEQCAESYVCGLEKQCITRPDVTAEAGCALPTSPTNGRGLELLLALPLLAAWRRRKSRR